MDDVEELPTWAARTHVPGSNLPAEELPAPRRRRPWRAVLLGLLALLVLAAIAAGGYLVADLSTGDETAASDGGAAADADGSDTVGSAPLDEAATDGSASGDSASGDSASGDSASGDSATDGGAAADGATDGGATANGASTEDSDTSAAADGAATSDDGGDTAAGPDADRGEVDNSDGSIRFAVLKGGQLFLRGRVHSEEYGRRIEEVALGVMGPGNVINEYDVDPSTPDVIGGPVYVEDVVLFEFNSIEVAPPFLPILDLGTALMAQNPTVEITVVSRTDAVGSEAVNMEVSEQRAQAVVNYWARQGVDTSRVTIDARGEEEASASDDQQEAALDRRVEFIINNLFG